MPRRLHLDASTSTSPPRRSTLQKKTNTKPSKKRRRTRSQAKEEAKQEKIVKNFRYFSSPSITPSTLFITLSTFYIHSHLLHTPKTPLASAVPEHLELAQPTNASTPPMPQPRRSTSQKKTNTKPSKKRRRTRSQAKEEAKQEKIVVRGNELTGKCILTRVSVAQYEKDLLSGYRSRHNQCVGPRWKIPLCPEKKGSFTQEKDIHLAVAVMLFGYRASFTRGGLNVVKNIKIFITLYTVIELGGEGTCSKVVLVLQQHQQ
ncbi:hypothetical protein LR48_Vigan03g157800 [Vigna angularis]|uniref:Uncharacterized protein n=1 Tax=Phaseolus angularis TaxID=3914 RepID=A0A0L9U5Z9_PHAAN|nr:hypothetical protein LR48_Vigan03g157800 [Vigna angularis]